MNAFTSLAASECSCTFLVFTFMVMMDIPLLSIHLKNSFGMCFSEMEFHILVRFPNMTFGFGIGG